MIKAIFIDVDGTLISKDQPYISDNVISGLKKLQGDGIKIIVASGRHYLELLELGVIKQFDFDGFLTMNGSYCYDKDNTVIYMNPIDKDDVKAIYDYINTEGVACSFVEADDLYVNVINERVIEAQEAIHTSLMPVKDIDRVLVNEIYQIVPFIDELQINEMLSNTKNCRYTMWHKYGHDIINKHGDKQTGIDAMLKYYGIDISEIMAFGDGHNDIGMLSNAKIGVCMEVAHEQAKACSDYITTTVENDGIIKALEHFGLL